MGGGVAGSPKNKSTLTTFHQLLTFFLLSSRKSLIAVVNIHTGKQCHTLLRGRVQVCVTTELNPKQSYDKNLFQEEGS